MIHARLVLAALVVAGAALAACSGNFGAGTTQPGAVIPSGPLTQPSPTPTPNTASGIVTYGESAALQPLPVAAGYGGAIAFPVPAPKPSGFDNIPVGVTVAVVAPTDTPDLNLQSRGRKPQRRSRPARALAYVTLLATRDITLDATPRLAIDIPREIMTTYREDELGLALYNASDKTRLFKLSVALLESASPAPSATPSAAASAAAAATTAASATASPPPTPSPTLSPTPSATPSPVPSGSQPPATPRPSPTPTPIPTLPPQRVTFAPAAVALKLTANKPVVFALYAIPVATPSPSPAASVSPAAAASPAFSPTATAAR